MSVTAIQTRHYCLWLLSSVSNLSFYAPERRCLQGICRISLEKKTGHPGIASYVPIIEKRDFTTQINKELWLQSTECCYVARIGKQNNMEQKASSFLERKDRSILLLAGKSGLSKSHSCN